MNLINEKYQENQKNVAKNSVSFLLHPRMLLIITFFIHPHFCRKNFIYHIFRAEPFFLFRLRIAAGRAMMAEDFTAKGDPFPWIFFTPVLPPSIKRSILA